MSVVHSSFVSFVCGPGVNDIPSGTARQLQTAAINQTKKGNKPECSLWAYLLQRPYAELVQSIFLLRLIVTRTLSSLARSSVVSVDLGSTGGRFLIQAVTFCYWCREWHALINTFQRIYFNFRRGFSVIPRKNVLTLKTILCDKCRSKLSVPKTCCAEHSGYAARR